MTEDVARLRLTVESTGVAKSRRELEQLSQSGKRAQASYAGAASGASALRGAMIPLGAAILATGASITKVTRDWLSFNKAMKEVETIAGVSGKQMDALRMSALRMSQSVGVDATEAAQGFYQAISAGIPTDKVAEFTKVASELALGGVSDVGSATDLLTTALNSYGKSADEARIVSDQLFRTVKLGKTNIPQLASSFARAAATASTAGVKLEELLGITAATTKQGTKTAENFTQIKAAIVALLNPSETLAAIYEQIGVSSGRQLIEQEGLAGALEKVRIATQGNDTVLVKALRSVEAYSLAAAVTGEKLAEAKKSIEEVGLASGDTAKAAGIVSDQLSVSLDKLGASLGILAENFNNFTGAEKGLSGSITNLSNILADPDLFSAYGQAFLEFPAIAAKFIFFNKGAEEQVSDYAKALEKASQAQRDFNSLTSQEQATVTSGTEVEAARQILKTEIELENVNKQLNQLKAAGLKVDNDNYKTKLDIKVALTNELRTYKEILDKGTDQRRITIELQKEIEKVNNELVYGRITEAEREKLVQEIVDRYEEIKEAGFVIEKTTQTVQTETKTWYNTLLDAVGATGKIKEQLDRQSAINATRLKIAGYIKEEEDESLKILEDKVAEFQNLIDQGVILTDAEKGILALYQNQLETLKQQTQEARKPLAQQRFESLRESLRTREEQASVEFSSAMGIIEGGEGTEEEKQLLRNRALQRFQEGIAPEEEGAISKGVDLQDNINSQADMLNEQYMSEIELIRKHEADKLEIVSEATNLSAERQKEIKLAIQADTNKQIEALEQAQFQERLGMASDFFGNLSKVAGAFGKKGAKAAKAFAIAQATIDTYASAVAAYKAVVGIPYVGPVLAPVAAAGAIAAGLAQISAIRSQNVEGNYQQGGIVGGNLYGGDQQLAAVNSGEMILNKTQQSRLLDLANNPLAGGDKKSGGNVTIVNNAPVQLQGEVESTQEGDLRIVIAEAVQQTKNELTNEAQEGGGVFFPAFEQSYGIARK